jgi:hypothetical protein
LPIFETAAGVVPVEIKSGETIRGSMFEGLGYWSKLTGEETGDGYLIYGGRENQDRKHGRVLGWQGMSGLLNRSR